MNDSEVITLIKIGRSDHMEALRERGHIHMKQWSSFKDRELNLANDQRVDVFEGSSHVANEDGRIVSWSMPDGMPFTGVQVGPTRENDPSADQTNIYCMFALQERSICHLAKDELLEFGDTAVVFLNALSFKEKLHSYLLSTWAPSEPRLGLVKYEDIRSGAAKGDSKNWGTHKKPSLFAHQNEYRFATKTNAGRAVDFELGSLADISMMVATTNLHSLLKDIRRID